MLVSRSHKIELRPTKEQQFKMNRMFLQTQALKHWTLELDQKMYQEWKEDNSKPYPDYYTLDKLYTQLKPECADLLPRCTATRCIRDVCTSVKNHLKNPAHFRLPSYTKKRDVEKYTLYIPNDKSYVRGNTVYLPKVGLIKLTELPRFTGKIMSYTFEWYAGKYWVVISYQIDQPTITVLPSTVGIDVGLKHIAITSDGTTLDYPESAKKALKRIKIEQKKLSRKQKESNNYNKQLIKLQRARLRRQNILNDVNHKFTTAVCKTHTTVVIEDLHLADLCKDSPHYMRAKFTESQMKKIHQMLEYKAIRLVKADRYFASSKTCSHCGHKKEDLKLSDRTYTCNECGISLDRDLNAALNLRNIAVGTVSPDQIQF